MLRLYGEVADHAQSVVLPLLLPDAPVVVWWPVDAPREPGEGPAGRARPAPDHRHVRRRAPGRRARRPAPTPTPRATPTWPGPGSPRGARCWPPPSTRCTCEVTSATVEGEAYNPSCELLAMWLADRLDVPVERVVSAGPGLTAVRLEHRRTATIVLDRAGRLAGHAVHARASRTARWRSSAATTAELIAEELRRLDPDDMYASALQFGVDRLTAAARRRRRRGAEPRPAAKPAGGRPRRPPPAGGARRPRRRPPARKAARRSEHAPQLVVHRDKELMAQAAAARLITKIVDAQAARGSRLGGPHRRPQRQRPAGRARRGARPGRGRLGAGSTCGGATSGSCPRATRSATSPRPARPCWTRCRWTRRGCTRCPRRTVRTAPTWRRPRRRTRRSWPRPPARRTTARCRPSTC